MGLAQRLKRWWLCIKCWKKKEKKGGHTTLPSAVTSLFSSLLFWWVGIELELDGGKARALGRKALLRSLEIHAAVVVAAHHVRHVGAVAVDVHVVAASRLDEASRGPHADAPRVSRVGLVADAGVPLPLLLARDLPEVALAPRERRTLVVEQPRANAVRLVVVAFEVAVSRTCGRMAERCANESSVRRTNAAAT